MFLRSAVLAAAGSAFVGLPARAEDGDGEQQKAAPSIAPLFAPSWPKLEQAPLVDAASSVQLPAFVKPRAAWGAALPAQPYVAHIPKGVSFHHTGAPWGGEPGPEQYLRNIQAFHVGPRREWEDIAYHFLIDLEGRVWAGRPPTVRGNPSIYYDPSGLVLICLLGDYTAQDPTDPQIASAAQTAAWAIKELKIPVEALSGHRDHAPTTCPGDKVYRLLQDGTFATQVRERLGR